MAIARTCIAVLASSLLAAPAFALLEGSARSHRSATVSTLITTPLVIEGLANDHRGNLYTPGRSPGAGLPCPVWRTAMDNPALVIVGLVPAPSATGSCSPSGLAFDKDGWLYVTQGDSIYRFMPDGAAPPTAEFFVAGVPGTNGVAFDRHGNLWTGDGTTGLGRVWKISPSRTVTEMFRVQPMANEVGLVAGVGGVGRDVRTLPPGTITVTPNSRNAANTAGSQPLVANGLAFTRNGDLLVADTARGAIWLVRIDSDGNVASPMGCDTTFTDNTLCMESVLVAHPLLEGVDGIVLDLRGGIWASANERNALVYVHPHLAVTDVFRNPADGATQLRNLGPLEFPASPTLVRNRLCTSSSDGNRRDNSPSTAGEIGGPGQGRGKISCIDQRITVDGVSLPIR